VTVWDHWTAAWPETGLIDSNRRLAAGRPVCSAATSAAADQGICTTSNPQSCSTAL
jgi:hypothetical protein